MVDSTPEASCTLSPEGAVTTVLVGTKCKVTYEFDTAATSAGLALPYVVAIDGQVQPEYADRPGALRGRRTIDLVVNPGSKVSLFLNSDVHPGHRRNPVYALEVGNHDVHVKITERTGRIGHEWATLKQPLCRPGTAPGKRLDVYEATLTGDIWMHISHLYTAGEADALLPPDTAPVVRAAVRSIFTGLPCPELIVNFPTSDSAPGMTLKVEFMEEMQNNVRLNTTHCPWLTGILPRTHPCAYGALLTEAHAAGVASVRVTSGWRPSFGSIAHRAGLGLDITYIEGDAQRVFLNRASLANDKAPRNGNVSEREKALWRDHQRAKTEVAASERELKAAQNRLDRNRDPGRGVQLKQELANAEDRVDASHKREIEASKEWNDERNRYEPGLIRKLRDKLGRNKSVKQLFDPWYMDANTADNVPPVPNEQRSTNPNERTHNNHLHITVLEPKIL
jgi:hypothetical protein